MGLTYRKNLGRPLTSDEIDANFEFFTSSLGGATTGSNTFVGNQIITGSILISGSIVPAVGVGQTTSSFDLGSPTAAWKDIYVSEGSIKFIKSGSASITLSAKDGGIQINGGSTISADGVSGQFITSKSLSDNITVKDSNNSLLMGPINVETDTEIIVEEDSDLTIFGDIEIQNVATADTALFAYSASYTDTASFAVTASYALNAPSAFPYSGSAVITGSLVVNNGTNNVVNTSNYQLLDSNGATSINWENKTLKNGNAISADWSNRLLQDSSEVQSVDWDNRKLQDGSDIKSVDWASRLLTDGTAGYITSVDWENRTLVNSDGGTAVDYKNSSSLLLTAGGSTLNVTKHTTYTADGAGSLTITSPTTKISGAVWLDTAAGVYGFTSASSAITASTPGLGSNTAVAFAQNGANFFIYVYIGGQWRSASLS
jgi:hypothetical protein